MKRAVVFGGAPIEPALQPPVPEAELYLCADAGIRLAEAFGILPDLVMGDFDSLGCVPEKVHVRVFPPEKDDTDLVIAAKYALEQGCDEVVFYGALGGRLDHTVANFQLLRMLADHHARGILVDEKTRVTLQRGGKVAYPRCRGYFSLFAWSEICEDVTVEGTKYPLLHGTLSPSFPIGVSNEIVAEHAVVTVGRGDLLVIYSQE